MIDYADDCVVDSPTGGTHQGRAAIAKVFKAVFDGFPDLKVTTDKLIIDGDSVSASGSAMLRPSRNRLMRSPLWPHSPSPFFHNAACCSA